MSILRCSHDASDMGYGTPKARTRHAAVHSQGIMRLKKHPASRIKCNVERVVVIIIFFHFL